MAKTLTQVSGHDTVVRDVTAPEVCRRQQAAQGGEGPRRAALAI
eukprot:gene54328-4925_t